MKPFKAGTIIATWLLRIMVLWFVYIYYFSVFTGFELKALSFYIATIYVIFSVLLFIGGFMKKHTLTTLSGLVLFILPIIQIIRSFPENPEVELFQYMIPVAIGFFFFTHGNAD